MKYFGLIFAGLSVAFILLTAFCVFKSLQKRLYRAVFIRKIGEFGDKRAHMAFFPTYMILSVADMVVWTFRKRRTELFKSVYAGRFDRLINFTKKKDKVLSALLKAYLYPENNLKQIRRELYLTPGDTRFFIMAGLDAEAKNNFKKLRLIVNKLSALKLNAPTKALFLYLSAKICLYDGDMYAASRNAVMAAGLFKKQKALREEAAAYMLLGEIYRFCAVHDVAQMMYDSAHKLYQASSSYTGAASSLAAKAMLLAGQERFDEAADLFRQSRQTFKMLKLTVKEAEIINQTALLNLMRGRLSASVKYAQKARDKHKSADNIQGEAYADELLALSFLKQQDYTRAIDYAAAAQKKYKKVENYAAWLDAAFVEAESWFKLQKLPASAHVCRRIIKMSNQHKTNFHIANTYTLLGLIYIRLQDFKRAEKLFKHSLDKEQADKRYSGIAADYVNLAQIEKHAGNGTLARHYLLSALDEAKKYNDDNMCDIINGQLEKLA